MGKAYTNRKVESERPDNDFYPTTKGITSAMVRELRERTGVPLLGCKKALSENKVIWIRHMISFIKRRIIKHG